MSLSHSFCGSGFWCCFAGSSDSGSLTCCSHGGIQDRHHPKVQLAQDLLLSSRTGLLAGFSSPWDGALLVGWRLPFKGQLTYDSWIHQNVPAREQKREYRYFYYLILEVTSLLLYLFFKYKLLKEGLSQDCDYEEAGLTLPHNFNKLPPA